MRIDTAIQLINDLVLKPGWAVTAEDNTKRFEGTVKLNVTYVAANTDREHAPGYADTVPGGARASFQLPVSAFDNDVELYRAILMVMLDIEQHEWREFLRVRSTLWAPFHPHHLDGMERWGTPEADFNFGLA